MLKHKIELMKLLENLIEEYAKHYGLTFEEAATAVRADALWLKRTNKAEKVSRWG